MARFLGRVQGGRGAATRLGGTNTGLRVEANGWDSGVRVMASVDSDGRDVFQVVMTGGSNGNGHEVEVARVVDGRLLRVNEEVAA